MITSDQDILIELSQNFIVCVIKKYSSNFPNPLNAIEYYPKYLSKNKPKLI